MPDIFPADIGGDVVNCVSREDAEGVEKAGDILDRPDSGPYPPVLIEYLASLLRWYGRHRASRTLEARHLTQCCSLPSVEPTINMAARTI